MALAALAALASLTHGSGVVRPLLVVLAASLVPGAALLTRLPAQDPLETVAIAITASLCIESIGALVMVWTGWWHPVGWALGLTAVACVMFALDLRGIVIARGTRRP
jgi:hypothetical protein